MIEYKVVTMSIAETKPLEKLAEEVEKLLNEGWRLVGGAVPVQISYDKTENHKLLAVGYIQTLVRNYPDPPETNALTEFLSGGEL